MIANAKIETVFTGFFSKTDIVFWQNRVWIQVYCYGYSRSNTKQKDNQKRKAAKAKPSWNCWAKGRKTTEINRVQRQKLVNETAQEKEIRLAKSGPKQVREREENILERGGSENVEKSEKADCKT